MAAISVIETVPIGSLNGGVRMSDPKEVARVGKLAEEIAGDDGYFSRILVNHAGDVMEGQHRLDALRKLGVDQVPITRVDEATSGLPVDAMRTAINASGKYRDEHVDQILAHVGDAIREEGSAQAVLDTHVFSL